MTDAPAAAEPPEPMPTGGETEPVGASAPIRATVSPYAAGLRSRCPRCGEGALFAGFLKVAPECPKCGLDLTTEDSGDGPAVFVIFIVGFVVTTAALAVELAFEPPYWVHAALWLPLTFGVSAALLRPIKATMIALQYHHKAEEARFEYRPAAGETDRETGD
ncbi:MAG: hypothetical protein Tsb0010_06390 [Parvularculaceae bacterium]